MTGSSLPQLKMHLSNRLRARHAGLHGSEGVTFKMKRDPRITPVGHMSLVGPRPPLVNEVERHTMQERQRLSVTPGLTCIWQVNGRSEIAFPQQVLMDIDYIQQRSISADVKLLAKTLPAVIRGCGAY
jgi:lipopolysaccharide/colanic/teichoic acid biosynthesis glycosyltransferase